MPPDLPALLLDDSFRLLIQSAEIEAAKAKGTTDARFFNGYLDGIRQGAVTSGTFRFDLLESEAEGVSGSYGDGLRVGLSNIEIVSAKRSLLR
jgi:hypothetical protein